MILLDSNIVLDLIVGNGAQAEWSRTTFARRAVDKMVVNLIVRAETAARFTTLEEQTGYFERLGVQIVPFTDAAAYRAGLAHRDYRRSGGERSAILADFLIGAHAATLGAALMTRDRARFSTYFPELTLITPETEQ